MVSMIPSERRSAERFDKIFQVLLSSEDFGERWVVGRNVSATGLLVEMGEPFPLKTKVIVRFKEADRSASLCAIAKVSRHYYLHYREREEMRAMVAIGLQFVRFVADAGEVPMRERMH